MHRLDDITAALKSFCIGQGAGGVGIAELDMLKAGLPTHPPGLLDPYTRAVSIHIPLDMKAVAGIMAGKPTPEYAADCRAINQRLNALTEAIAGWITEKGYRAEPVPASKKIVEGGTEGSVSHKAIAVMAGLGWQGKSLLLVTEKYGPRVRLSTVLTDMPLLADQPLRNRCGHCKACMKACPAGAIRGVNTELHYETRHEAIDLEKCHSQTQLFSKLPGVEYTFCGQCIPVCPYGSRLMRAALG